MIVPYLIAVALLAGGFALGWICKPSKTVTVVQGSVRGPRGRWVSSKS